MVEYKFQAAIDLITNSQLFQEYITDMPIFENAIKTITPLNKHQHETIGFSHVLVPNTLPLIVSILKLNLQISIFTENNFNHDPETISLLQKSGIILDPPTKEFDYTIDCNGFFTDKLPLKGSVEVTKSGIIKYTPILENSSNRTKLVDVDNSRSKLLETFIGNPKAVLQTLKHYKGDLNEYFNQLEYQKVAIVGFGKIGRGLAREVRETKLSSILVCDISEEALILAKSLGFETHRIENDKELNSKPLSKVSIIFTATGHKSTMTRYFHKEMLNKTLKINIGAVDEWGEDYSDVEIFHSKNQPFNFNLTPPTDNKYIDPILYAHFQGLVDLITNYDSYLPGYNKFPKSLDDEIIQSFDFHYSNESQILMDYFPVY